MCFSIAKKSSEILIGQLRNKQKLEKRNSCSLSYSSIFESCLFVFFQEIIIISCHNSVTVI